MKLRSGIFSLTTTVVLGALGLIACWDAASLNAVDDAVTLADSDAATADAESPTADAETPPGSCLPPLAQCGPECTDTSSDPFNCGTCGNDCTVLAPPAPTCVGAVATAFGPPICAAATCEFSTSTVDCGAINRVCQGGACGGCASGYQDNDLNGTCTPNCATAALTCSGHGACSDVGGTAECVCDLGFEGTSCATNIDDCIGAPCLNGGTCVDGVASYTCQCIGGFTGNNCENAPSSLVFVSSATTTGNIGGLAAADAICQGLATAKGFGGTFKALLSDGTASAAARLGRPPGSYKLVDGTVIANTADDLYAGSILAPLDKDESGVLVNAEVWTGSGATGTSSGSNCNDWTDGTSGVLGTEGVNNFTDGRWLDSYVQFCDRVGRLYCVQQ